MVKVFDLDGTLLDSNRVWREIDATVIRNYGHELTEEYMDFVAHAIFPAAAKFTKEYYGLSASEEEIMQAWHTLAFEAYSNRLQLKPHAKEYLERCAEKGDRMVMYTACEPGLCRAALEHHGIAPLFERILYAQELGLEKLYPESFRKISEMLGEDPENCLMFDDSPVVCAVARNAGWRAIGVADSLWQQRWEEMRSLCDEFIEEYSGVSDIF